MKCRAAEREPRESVAGPIAQTLTVKVPEPPEVSVRLEDETEQVTCWRAPEHDKLTIPLNPVRAFNCRLSVAVLPLAVVAESEPSGIRPEVSPSEIALYKVPMKRLRLGEKFVTSRQCRAPVVRHQSPYGIAKAPT